jgi:hypothetical protein
MNARDEINAASLRNGRQIIPANLTGKLFHSTGLLPILVYPLIIDSHALMGIGLYELLGRARTCCHSENRETEEPHTFNFHSSIPPPPVTRTL